jgi:hypothetical protein
MLHPGNRKCYFWTPLGTQYHKTVGFHHPVAHQTGLLVFVYAQPEILAGQGYFGELFHHFVYPFRVAQHSQAPLDTRSVETLGFLHPDCFQMGPGASRHPLMGQIRLLLHFSIYFSVLVSQIGSRVDRR